MGTDRLDKMRMELRRGVLVLAVLASLREERYGYSLRKHLSDSGIEIDEGTLYPLVRRLESQELLTSEWRVEEGRKRRFYRISELGMQLLSELNAEWESTNASMQMILEDVE